MDKLNVGFHYCSPLVSVNPSPHYEILDYILDLDRRVLRKQLSSAKLVISGFVVRRFFLSSTRSVRNTWLLWRYSWAFKATYHPTPNRILPENEYTYREDDHFHYCAHFDADREKKVSVEK